MNTSDRQTAPSSEITALLRDLRARLEELYGERLHAVVLYGSHARGEATEATDVDVMVVLEGEVDPYEEVETISESAYQVSSQYDELVSIFLVSRAEFDDPREAVILNAQKEGVRA